MNTTVALPLVLHGRRAIPNEPPTTRGWAPGVSTLSAELLTWANLVTAVRLLGGLTIFGAFWLARGELWNFVGLGVYWLGDVLDGYLARRLRQETVFGAQFDILSDRILVCLFYLGYVTLHPVKTPAALLFLLEFAVVDHYVSNQFVRWPILSPNYFHLIDRPTWLWLWSPAAKALNCGLVTVLLIGLPWQWPAISATLALILIRVWCIHRVLGLALEAASPRRSTPHAA